MRRLLLPLLPLLAAVAALAGCGGGVSSAAQPPAATQAASAPATTTAPHWVDVKAPAAERRTVLVFTGAGPGPSKPGLLLNAVLVEGAVPTRAVVATVLTDEDCNPDAEGISHCLNKLRLPDGSALTVRHAHDMSLVPCLSPGERVEVRAAA